jgi:hypothetical protein
MNARTAAGVMAMTVLTLLAGCATPELGPAFGREEDARRQLTESIPMKVYGYTLKDLRFTPDYKKALVVFTHPGHQEDADNTRRRPDWEFVLTADEFGRYRGMSIQPFYTPGGGGTTPAIFVTLSFPVEPLK